MKIPILALVVLPLASFCQTRPAFEVASVKQNKSGNNAMNNHYDPGRVSWTNVSLRVLITYAWHLRDYQLSGAPAWISTDRWDIDATTGLPTNMAEKMERMQGLIEERFHFAFHSETRQLQEFNLEVAKGGHKLKSAEAGDENLCRPGVQVQRGLIAGCHTGIPNLVFFISGELGRPVVDKTGLTGEYNFRLEWLPDESQPNGGHEVPSADAAGPPIFTAIQGLGLRLAPFKGPVEIMVVDHVEKPADN